MVRTQFQLDDATYEALRNAAHKQRKSMSSVARDILKEHLLKNKTLEEKMFSFVGAGSSGHSDISERHDEALDEDFR